MGYEALDVGDVGEVAEAQRSFGIRVLFATGRECGGGQRAQLEEVASVHQGWFCLKIGGVGLELAIACKDGFDRNDCGCNLHRHGGQ